MTMGAPSYSCLFKIAIPKNLPGAIAEARAALESHKATRPASLDILARTAWAQEKDLLESSILFLEETQRIERSRVEIIVAQPAAEAPRPKGYRPAHRKDPKARLEGALRKQASYFYQILHARDAADAAHLRQSAFSLRHDIKTLCREFGMAFPELAPVPSNPFTPCSPEAH